MPTSTIQRFITEIPKAELHVHVEGTLEPELKFLLGDRNGVDLPYADVDQLRAAYDFDDLPSFLAQYYEGMSVLLTEDDFYDLAMAYFTRVAAQNVVYVEMFFDPQAHTSRGVEFRTVIGGLRRAQGEAERTLGVRSRLILCFLRDESVESANSTLAQAMEYREWIVGVGLDSNEAGNPPVKFRELFAAARDAGFKLTMHCDVDQANSVTHLWQCLEEIGVDRIDHGVNALEDESLCDAIVERNLALTVCPISNSYVTDGTKAAAIKEMLRRGMNVTVNSDDPAYFPGYMTENLVAVHEEVGLDQSEIEQLVRNSFEAAWMADDERHGFISLLDDFVAAR